MTGRNWKAKETEVEMAMQPCTLRQALFMAINMSAKYIESVVIAHADGAYEAAPRASWLEHASGDRDARIAYAVRSLEEFGDDATVDDVQTIVDDYILPNWEKELK
jgi:hypothetical protein